MALSSMTGFARAEGANEICSWVWEIKSVNAKGLDFRLKLPGGFEALDLTIRERVKKYFRRGNFAVALRISWHISNVTHRINLETLKCLLETIPAVEKLAPKLKPVTIDGLLAARGVVESTEATLTIAEQNSLDEEVLIGLDELLEQLKAVRLREGEELQRLLGAHLELIEMLCGEANALASSQPERIKKHIQAQIVEFCEAKSPLSEERLAQEVIVLMLKADVREEIDRILVHIKAGRELMISEAPIGRQFDFLCQEFNREVNTLCSKASDVALTQVGLRLKTVIDQIREQLQNVE